MASSPATVDQLAEQRETIYRYILGIVRNPAEADDLTQEALLRAHTNLSSLDDDSKLIPWLYRIATNVTYDRFRQASYRHRPQPLAEDAGGDLDTGLVQIAVESGPRLDKAMEQNHRTV